MSDSHTLRGTIHVSNAETAEERVQQAVRDYFGDVPVRMELSVDEQRTIGGQVIGYQVDYTAERLDESTNVHRYRWLAS